MGKSQSKFVPHDPDATSWAQPSGPNFVEGEPVRRKKRKPYFANHHRFRVWVSHGEWKRIERQLQRTGLSAAEWFRESLARAEAERPSEAGTYVRRIIPEPETQGAAFALNLFGEIFLNVANSLPASDWEYKKRLRETGGRFLDFGAWFTAVLDDYGRLHREEAAEPPRPPTTSEIPGHTAASRAIATRPPRPRDGVRPTPPPSSAPAPRAPLG